MKIIVLLILIIVCTYKVSLNSQENKDSLIESIRLEIMKYNLYDSTEKSIMCVNKLINIDSNNPEYYYEKGDYYMILDKNDSALFFYDKALLLGGDSVDIFLSISLIYERTDRFKKALNWMDKAIAVKPDSAELYIKRSFINVLMKKDDSIILKDLEIAKELGSKRAIELIEITKENSEPYYMDFE
jgi:tetratricopeptide (TPR) repeat protein